MKAQKPPTIMTETQVNEAIQEAKDILNYLKKKINEEIDKDTNTWYTLNPEPIPEVQWYNADRWYNVINPGYWVVCLSEFLVFFFGLQKIFGGKEFWDGLHMGLYRRQLSEKPYHLLGEKTVVFDIQRNKPNKSSESRITTETQDGKEIKKMTVYHSDVTESLTEDERHKRQKEEEEAMVNHILKAVTKYKAEQVQKKGSGEGEGGKPHKEKEKEMVNQIHEAVRKYIGEQMQKKGSGEDKSCKPQEEEEAMVIRIRDAVTKYISEQVQKKGFDEDEGDKPLTEPISNLIQTAVTEYKAEQVQKKNSDEYKRYQRHKEAMVHHILKEVTKYKMDAKTGKKTRFTEKDKYWMVMQGIDLDTGKVAKKMTPTTFSRCDMYDINDKHVSEIERMVDAVQDLTRDKNKKRELLRKNDYVTNLEFNPPE